MCYVFIYGRVCWSVFNHVCMCLMHEIYLKFDAESGNLIFRIYVNCSRSYCDLYAYYKAEGLSIMNQLWTLILLTLKV